jgi:hypothetical protein
MPPSRPRASPRGTTRNPVDVKASGGAIGSPGKRSPREVPRLTRRIAGVLPPPSHGTEFRNVERHQMLSDARAPATDNGLGFGAWLRPSCRAQVGCGPCWSAAASPTIFCPRALTGRQGWTPGWESEEDPVGRVVQDIEPALTRGGDHPVLGGPMKKTRGRLTSLG